MGPIDNATLTAVAVAGMLSGFSEQMLELGESLLNRVQVCDGALLHYQ